MEERTTYSLRVQGPNSDDYYRTIASFADQWLQEVRSGLARPVKDFMDFRSSQHGSEPSRAPTPGFDEAAFEILVLGVQLRENGAQALQLAPAPTWVLARLVEAQDRLPIPAMEKPIKAMRAIVQGLAAGDEAARDAARDAAQPVVDEIDYKDGPAGAVRRLVEWLRAQGSSAPANRLEDWAEYLSSLEAQQAEAVLARCLILAEDFAAQSEAALGQYTRQVDGFVSCVQGDQGTRWRYDSELITRTRVEYHLGMLGTEILTRVYRERFLATSRKIVVVPDCLCARSDRVAQRDAETCQAEWTDLGGRCQGCTPGCRVRALTNWDAGWLVNDAGVPAQGVLLDYAGCRSHWHEDGVSTDLNFKKLLETIGTRPPENR